MIIITGTSRGIGKAVAEQYLAQGKRVVGISRSCSIEHPLYTHLVCDLSSNEAVAALQLPIADKPVIFIHNAGMLGQVNRFSDTAQPDAGEVMQVNYTSGTVLLHHLMKQLKPKQQFTGVFVSSGAGKRPIPSWAAYCASKAAVDLFLQTVQAEEDEKSNGNGDSQVASTLRVYAFSPGVVDTAMQADIRSTNEHHFSSSERFHSLHQNGELKSPEEVAEKIIRLIEQRPTDRVLCSVTDL